MLFCASFLPNGCWPPVAAIVAAKVKTHLLLELDPCERIGNRLL